MLRVGINGFGRIGRCLFRLNHELPPEKRFEVVVFKDVIPLENIAYLLRYDSSYGDFKGTVDIDQGQLVVDGKKIPYVQEPHIDAVPWEDYGVQILVEASGKVPDTGTLRSILKGELTNIVYGRNVDNADVTIVYGTNQNLYSPGVHQTISASSCTGNAIVPILDVLMKHAGVEAAHFVSIHPALSGQGVLDGAHSNFQLGRSAMASIIPTSSGIPMSVEQVFPILKDKVTSITYRIPTTLVSAIDAHLQLSRPVERDEINALFQKSSCSNYAGILKYDEGYLGHSKVSIDFIKSPYSVFILGLNTQAQGKNLSLALFHDNEWGYCHRFHDLIQYIHECNHS